ncbi:MAG: crossover junction endodeoxyribonuclease RuvC [Smithella sp.]|nr:crossover junction endodeoxyribonuclease RuvC [Syntrophaceae bacterium]NMC91857.1 crossover junction endodeoxyribonuclease RuvC [Smithella sp.]OQC73154.1 MAG: Crossover junction endodeoxyribonuclease RuvC [Deltaproteobacteria bacterium ADurb.Bin002]HNV57302.1 crossover junction endodeoxyribonuclease RuvC [Smithellaceae bacterium]MBP8666638.1 crossover junction endodeoxyribonuclease RuvC [Syntrophaceae bacterium]
MRILGIDPGSHVTGYGVIDKSGNYLRHVAHGEIKARRNSLLSEVLMDTFRELGAVIADNNPQAVSLENIFYGKNVRSLIRQAQVRGVVICACADRGLPVFEYSPLEVKKAVVGYGRAEKRQVQIMVKAILKLDGLPPADAADALAAAICQANFMKEQPI